MSDDFEYMVRVTAADGTVLDTSKPRTKIPDCAWGMAAEVWRARYPGAQAALLRRRVGSSDMWERDENQALTPRARQAAA